MLQFRRPSNRGRRCIDVFIECSTPNISVKMLQHYFVVVSLLQLIQSCPPASTGGLYPPTVLCGLAPSCESVISPPPGPVLPLITFRSSAEGVTLGEAEIKP